MLYALEYVAVDLPHCVRLLLCLLLIVWLSMITAAAIFAKRYDSLCTGQYSALSVTLSGGRQHQLYSRLALGFCVLGLLYSPFLPLSALLIVALTFIRLPSAARTILVAPKRHDTSVFRNLISSCGDIRLSALCLYMRLIGRLAFKLIAIKNSFTGDVGGHEFTRISIQELEYSIGGANCYLVKSPSIFLGGIVWKDEVASLNIALTPISQTRWFIGREILCHELVHVMQQIRSRLLDKEREQLMSVPLFLWAEFEASIVGSPLISLYFLWWPFLFAFVIWVFHIQSEGVVALVATSLAAWALFLALARLEFRN